MTRCTGEPRRAVSLVADEALTLEIECGLSPLVATWLPWHLEEPSPGAIPGATIRVSVSTAAAPPPDSAATLALGPVRGWLDAEQELLRLHGAAAASRGIVDLASRRATLGTDPAAVPEAGSDLHAMLTIASALLLAALGRALVHAAGVVAPQGSGWLLVGDPRTGKSTTCANLVRAGWRYLSDDQVVLGAGSAPTDVVAEGWLRPFHLDCGWPAGETRGARSAVMPSALGPGGWRRAAPLVGLLFPIVRRNAPTQLTALSSCQALEDLLRRSPWLLACRTAAPGVLALLRRAAEQSASYRLELGLDVYRDGDRLRACLASLPLTP